MNPASIDIPLNLSAPIDGLYLHVPFCFHKCHYCDFYSITRQTPDRMDEFVGRILKEAEIWRNAGLAPRPRTIFFGGGTPSLLPPRSMESLLTGLARRFDLSVVDEWTVEVNPATADFDFCRLLHENGVTRLSFGAQSFDRGELNVLERHHDPEDVPRSVEMARRAGFDRLNVDLIYAVPGQSVESWTRSLNRAIELGTSHLSCYGLTYEPNTPMAVKRRLGVIRAVEENVELEMFRRTRRRLREIGWSAYEISNYAAAGQECRHNLVYWTGGNYLGLGPSAASHIDGARWRNRPHLGEWERAIDAGAPPATDIEQLSPARRAGELAMLMLRLGDGLKFDAFAVRTGFDARAVFADPIDRFVRAGLLRTDDAGVRLTEAGVEVADAISAEFLDPDPLR